MNAHVAKTILRSNILVASIISLLLSASQETRADQSWIGGTGDWNNPANWSGSAVPNAEWVRIDNSGTAQIGGDMSGISGLSIANSSVLEFNLGGSLRNSGDLYFDGAGGTLWINNGGTLTLTGGKISGGNTIVKSGGVLNLGASDDSSWGRIGNNGPLTTLTIDGGRVNAQYTEGDGIVIGDYFATTYLNIVTNGLLYMAGKRVSCGWWNGGVGYIDIDGGTISFDDQNGAFWIGAGHDDANNPAKGYVSLRNGASISKTTAQTDGWGDLVVGTRWGGWADNNYGELTLDATSSIFWQRGALMMGRDAMATGVLTNNGGTITIPDAFMSVGQGGGNGTLVMNGGTLTHGREEFYIGTDSGSIGNVIVNGGTLNHTSNWRFAVGNWGGQGSLTINGASTVVDTGPNEFQVGNDSGSVGTVTINDGTLNTHSWTAIARNGTGNGHLILNGGAMNVKGDGNWGYLQLVAGAGGTGLIDINGGVLKVTGGDGTIRYQDWGDQTGDSYGTINLNPGGRLIAGNIAKKNAADTTSHAVFNFNGGILQPNNGDVLHDIDAANVSANGAIIEFTQNSTSLRQPLVGDGPLIVRGNGVMSDANDENMLIIPHTSSTFTGGTVISNAAHVRIGNASTVNGDGALGAPASGLTLDGGGLKNNDDSEPVLNASRTVTLGTNGGYFTVGWGDRAMTILGPVTGPGGLNVCRDGGHLVLANPANDYAGDTRVGANGPGRWTDGNNAGLYLGASDVIPNGPGKGNLVIDGGYSGNLNMNGNNETVNGLTNINGGRIWNSGSLATLTVGDNDTSSTFGGTIQNAIGLTKIGNGVLAITAVNSYTGATVIASGKVLLSTTPQPGLAAGTASGGDMGTPNPRNEGVALTTVAANTTAFPPWAEEMQWIYTGYINNPGTNSVLWTFGENVDDKTWLKIDSTVVLDNGDWNVPTLGSYTLTPGSHFFEARFYNGVPGAGAVDSDWWTGVTFGFGYDSQGRGAADIANFTAITDPGDGTVFTTGPKYNVLPSASALTLNAGATLDLGGTIQTFAGIADGTTGGGTIMNSATGTVAALILNLPSSSSDVFSGTISSVEGPVAFEKTGGGQVTLIGSNVVAGGATVSAGILQIGDTANDGALQGTILNNAALVFATRNDYNCASPINGTGYLVKNGPGTLTLNGANGQSGDVFVDQGALILNGTLGSSCYVEAGATLGGKGMLAGAVNSYGTLKPGETTAPEVGLLQITGDYSESSDSVLHIEIRDSVNYGHVTVNSIVWLAGALKVTFLDSNYVPAVGDAFSILSASGGFAGTTFSSSILPPLGANKDWQIAYVGNTVVLSVVASGGPTGYNAWIAGVTNGLTNYWECALGDGYPNLLKYATGSSLTNCDDLAKLTVSQSGMFPAEVFFHRNAAATDVTIVLEASDICATNALWNSIATYNAGVWTTTAVIFEIRDTTPIGVIVGELARTNRFYRLRVTRP